MKGHLRQETPCSSRLISYTISNIFYGLIAWIPAQETLICVPWAGDYTIDSLKMVLFISGHS